MKAASFAYIRAADLPGVLGPLSAGEDCVVIAGGQTLVPLMAMRFAQPGTVVDIMHVPELMVIEDQGDHLAIRAAVTQAAALESEIVRTRVPLLWKALSHVGNVQTRNRGTVCGSLAFADPSAEVPLAAVVLGATLVTRRMDAQAELAASEFFVGPMMTKMSASDCLYEARFAYWSGGRVGTAFEEVSVRHSDFAIASAACQLEADAKGRCSRIALGLGGVYGTPCAVPEPEGLIGVNATPERVGQAVHNGFKALSNREDVQITVHADAEYRKRVSEPLLCRAVMHAYEDATKPGGV